MFAVDVQTVGSVGLILLVFAFIEWVVKYLSLNMSLWVTDQVGTDTKNSPMWAPPIPALAFYLLLLTKGVEAVFRRFLTGQGERTLESLSLSLSVQMIVATLIGGWIVRNSLGFTFAKGVAVAAVTWITSTVVTGILGFLLLNVTRPAA